MTTSINLPKPRAAIADQSLTRPDWTVGVPRDASFIWLDKNENSDPELAQVVRDIVANLAPEVLYSYPESAPLYQRLATHLKVGANNILLAAGSDGVIRSIFEAYVEPGDIIVHTSPTFAMYGVYSAMYGAEAKTVVYSASDQGPVLDPVELVNTIKETQPKLVCLPNPDSPTGTVFPECDLQEIIEVAGQVGALILVDEAYYPFSSYTALPLLSKHPNLVIARSTGKAWGMAGLRLGYAIGSPEIIGSLHKVRPMYETNTLAVAVFLAMLDHYDEVLGSVERLKMGKVEFLIAMGNLGFKTLPSEGNFLHVDFANHADKVHAILERYVYYRRDFSEPCLRGYSRFTTTTPALFAPIIELIRGAVQGVD